MIKQLQGASRYGIYLSAVLVSLGIGTIGPSLASASIPDSSGVIHACYASGEPMSGNLRVSDSGSCDSGETAVAWQRNGSAEGVLRANVTGADMTNAQMVYWDLRNRDFSGADLSHANLTGADLRGANFTGAKLDYANMKDTDLRGTTFTNANITYATLVAANLTGNAISDANFTDADFSGANISGVTFTDTNLTGANFTGQDLTGFDLSTDNIQAMGVKNGIFSNMILGANPQLHVMDLEGATVANNDFSGGNLSGIYLTGANFSDNNTDDVTWDDENYGTAYCVDGTRAVDNSGDTCDGHF